MYNFTATWVEQALDSMCIPHIKQWLEMPISACLKETIVLPKNNRGLGLDSIKHLSEKMTMICRHTLSSSVNDDVHELWLDSRSQHVPIDSLLIATDSVTAATNELKKRQMSDAVQHVHSFKIQGVIMKTVTENVSKKKNISVVINCRYFLTHSVQLC